MSERVEDVRSCARCGGDHKSVLFWRLTRPVEFENVGIELTYWALCPANGEPILMALVPIPMFLTPFPISMVEPRNPPPAV